MEEHGSNAYLINTGWIKGKYGVGNRIPLIDNRKTIDAIFDGSLENEEYETMPIFNLQIPKKLNGVDTNILNPRNVWDNKDDYDATAKNLAQMFIDNFKKFTDTEQGKSVEEAGPSV